MKKLLILIFGLTLIAGTFGATYACEEVHLDDGDVCIDIEKDGNDYTLDTTLSNYDGGGTAALNCYVFFPTDDRPEGKLFPVGACNGTFEIDENDIKKVKIFVRLNGGTKNGNNGYIYEYYDFDDGERSNSSSSSNSDLDDFDFTYVEDRTPDKDQWITVKIEAQDDDNDRVSDYDDEATLIFEYKYGSSWREVDDNDIKIKSDDFNDDEDDIDSYGELDVDFDNGRLEFEVWFENEDEYRITVKDGSANERQEFDVGGSSSSSNNDLDDFDFTYVEDRTPDKDKWITVKIEAQDDDNDRVSDYDDEATLIFEYKYGSSWREVDDNDIKIKSDDFNDDEDDIDSDGELDVDFDNGRLEFEVWFENEDEYRITVKDGSANERQEFDVGDNGNEDSDVDGFTNKEFETTERIYKVRPQLIRQLKKENNDLDHDNKREKLSDGLYDDMKDVIDDDHNRAFDDYDEFFDAFKEWYSYTLDVIH